MKLEDIGFYTLSDHRAKHATHNSQLQRCELILTSACNFNCPYCMPIKDECQGTLPIERAKDIVDKWTDHGLRHIRFSGGEPTLYKHLAPLVGYCKKKGVERVALSTNGSAERSLYGKLLDAGVDDVSVSFDACCSATGDTMSGRKGMYRKVVENIEWLASKVYTTVGVVLTRNNLPELFDIIAMASGMGVQDIRVIPAAQFGSTCSVRGLDIPPQVLDKHPILAYRLRRFYEGEHVRGLRSTDTKRCPLVLDDMAIAGNYHFPCIIYFRQYGKAIGTVDDKSIEEIRAERKEWFENTNTHKEPICKGTCLDVCVDYNNKWEAFRV